MVNKEQVKESEESSEIQKDEITEEDLDQAVGGAHQPPPPSYLPPAG